MLDGQPLGEYPELRREGCLWAPCVSCAAHDEWESWQISPPIWRVRSDLAMRTITQNQRDIEDALIRLRCARRAGDAKEELVCCKRINDLLNRESRGRGSA